MSEYSWKFLSATAVSAHTPLRISRSASWKAYGSDEVSTWSRPSTSSPRISGTHMTLRMAWATIDSWEPKWRSARVSTDRMARLRTRTSSTMVWEIRSWAGSSTAPPRRRAATGRGGSRSVPRSMMKARSASGNRSKIRFMILSIRVAWSVTAPSAMLTWAIACSRCTVFSSSLRAAFWVSTTGAKRVASTERVMTVGALPRSGSISEWKTSWAEASASSSPSRSACQLPGGRRSPDTKVPLRECRSSMKYVAPRRRMRAWRRLMVCSGMQMFLSSASASCGPRPTTASSCSGKTAGLPDSVPSHSI